ncbi:MAG: hypothetical protein LBQ68_09095, partial [Clostridiales bacterium]|nr:hypothetical protein [Clostridiales bacterium]
MNDVIAINRKESIPHVIFNAALLFFAVFSIHPVGFPSGLITPRNIVIAYILFTFLMTKVHQKQAPLGAKYWHFLFLSAMILLYAFFITYVNGVFRTANENAVTSAFNFLIFVAIVPPMFYGRFTGLKD